MALTQEQLKAVREKYNITPVQRQGSNSGTLTGDALIERLRGFSKEPETAKERIGERVAESKESISEAVSGTGDFAERSGVGRVASVGAKVLSLPFEAAYEVLPEKVRNVFDKIGGGIGKGIEAYTNIPMVRKAADKLVAETDPQRLAKIEDALMTLADTGIIAGSVLGAGEAVAAGKVGATLGKKVAKETAKRVTETATDIGKFTTSKAKRILGNLPSENLDDAIKQINNSYKSAFVEDKVGINNKLTKLGRKKGLSPDELVENLSREGIAPQVEGKLAKFDTALDELNLKTREIDSTIKESLKAFDKPEFTTNVDDFGESIRLDIRETADPASLNKALKELDRTIESYRTKYGDELTPSQINEIRISANKATKSFDREIFENDVSNSIGNSARNRIDDIVPDEVVRKANAESGRIRDLEDTIKVFDNQPIDVGFLGTSVGKLGGALLAGAPLLAISGPGALVVAGIAATYGGNFVAKFLRSKKFSKAAQDMIKKSLKESPDILEDLIKEASKENAKFLQQLRLPEPAVGAVQKQINVPVELPTRGLPDEPQASNIVK